jgi:hypothetical protein
MIKRQVLFGVLLSAQVLVSHAQNLITNGSFESVIPAVQTLSVGSTNLSGWSVGGTGTVFTVTSLALDGGRSISFNHNTVTLSQSFETTPGNDYDVAFTVGYYQGNKNMAVTGQILSTNNTILGSLTANAPTNVGWGPQARFRFTATTRPSVLTFRGTNATPNVDLLMDDVSVEPIARLLSIQNPPLRLCWESKTNRFYQLQSRPAFDTNSWTNLDPSIAGSGAIICNTQSVNEPQQFFRVITLP